MTSTIGGRAWQVLGMRGDAVTLDSARAVAMLGG